MENPLRYRINQASTRRPEDVDLGVSLNGHCEAHGLHTSPTTPIRCRERVEERASGHVTMIS